MANGKGVKARRREFTLDKPEKEKTMLVAVQNGIAVPVTTQAHDWWFRQWVHLLAPGALQRIEHALNRHINAVGRGQIITTSWIPGEDWTGTPYEPIWWAVQDWNLARLFFGLIVWSVMMNRQESWSFGRYPKRAGDVIGLTYFRV